jgi:antitoxin component YwqK of YwqJK toxin-antitoxin module
MPRQLLFLLLIASLTSCNELGRKFAENVVHEKKQRDSVLEYKRDHPISYEKYEIVERKKVGEDSLYLLRTYLLNGKKFSEVWFKWQTRHGTGKFYYNNGQLAYSFNYRNDTIVGMPEAYTPTGEKRPESYAKNGTGIVRIYHPTTYNLILDYTIKNCLKEGPYATWYENGNAQEEGFFVHDSLVGDYRKWYKSGFINFEKKGNRLKNEVTFIQNFPSGKLKLKQINKNNELFSKFEYDEEGRVIADEKRDANGEMIGYKYFYGTDNKLFSKGGYVNGMKQGSYEYFHPNGKRKALEIYSRDTLLSEKRWHENGNPGMEATYKKGELHGTLTQYFENGQIMLKQEYVNGVKEGKYVSYYSNGKLCNEGSYADGKPKGEMKYYKNDGSFSGTKNFP